MKYQHHDICQDVVDERDALAEKLQEQVDHTSHLEDLYDALAAELATVKEKAERLRRVAVIAWSGPAADTRLNPIANGQWVLTYPELVEAVETCQRHGDLAAPEGEGE